MLGAQCCATQPPPRLQSTDWISRVPKNQIYFPVVSLKFAETLGQAFLCKRKDNLVSAHIWNPAYNFPENVQTWFSKCWRRYAVGKWRHDRRWWGRVFGGVLVSGFSGVWRMQPGWIEASGESFKTPFVTHSLVVEDGFMTALLLLGNDRFLWECWKTSTMNTFATLFFNAAKVRICEQQINVSPNLKKICNRRPKMRTNPELGTKGNRFSCFPLFPCALSKKQMCSFKKENVLFLKRKCALSKKQMYSS